MSAKIIFTDEQVAYIKKRYLEDSVPVDTIGKELGVSNGPIDTILCEAGIKYTKHRSCKRPQYPVDAQGNKRCVQCLQVKAASEFRRLKNRHHVDGYGYNAQCNPCANQNLRNARAASLGVNYDAMLVEQQGLCALCHKPETKTGQYGVYCLALDHDHSNGKARSLLCSRCNKLLGALNDNSTLFRAFADYIDNWRQKHEKG